MKLRGLPAERYAASREFFCWGTQKCRSRRRAAPCWEPVSFLPRRRSCGCKLGLNPDKDLTIVSGTSSGVLPVVVHKSLPAEVKDLKSFIDYAKTNRINFGSWALGSSAHIFAQSLNEKYGLAMVVVTYKGEAPMWQDMGAGSLQAAMGSPQAMNALLVKEEVRPIVAPSRVRYVKLPNVTTSAEQ